MRFIDKLWFTFWFKINIDLIYFIQPKTQLATSRSINHHSRLEFCIVNDSVSIFIATHDYFIQGFTVHIVQSVFYGNIKSTFEHLLELFSLDIPVPILVQHPEDRFYVFLLEQLLFLHGKCQKLCVVKFSVFVCIDWFHDLFQLLQRWLVLFIWKGNFQLLNRNLSVMIQVNLLEKFAQLFHILFRHSWSNVSCCQFFKLVLKNTYFGKFGKALHFAKTDF